MFLTAIDKTLLPGQVLIATIPFVSGVQSFFIHLQSDLVNKMGTLIADYVTKEVIFLKILIQLEIFLLRI